MARTDLDSVSGALMRITAVFSLLAMSSLFCFFLFFFQIYHVSCVFLGWPYLLLPHSLFATVTAQWWRKLCWRWKMPMARSFLSLLTCCSPCKELHACHCSLWWVCQDCILCMWRFGLRPSGLFLVETRFEGIETCFYERRGRKNRAETFISSPIFFKSNE